MIVWKYLLDEVGHDRARNSLHVVERLVAKRTFDEVLALYRPRIVGKPSVARNLVELVYVDDHPGSRAFPGVRNNRAASDVRPQ